MTELNGSRLVQFFSLLLLVLLVVLSLSLIYSVYLLNIHWPCSHLFSHLHTLSHRYIYSFYLSPLPDAHSLTHWHTRTMDFVTNYNGWNPKRCCDTIIVIVIRAHIISIMISEWKPFLWWIGCIISFVVSYHTKDYNHDSMRA